MDFGQAIGGAHAGVVGAASVTLVGLVLCIVFAAILTSHLSAAPQATDYKIGLGLCVTLTVLVLVQAALAYKGRDM